MITFDTSFWYLVSFIIFLIIALRPTIRFIDSIIVEEQKKFLQKLSDAQAFRTTAYAKLRDVKHQSLDLSVRTQEVERQADNEIEHLKLAMRDNIENYKVQHHKLLVQRLKIFESETSKKFKESSIKVLIQNIKDKIETKIDPKFDLQIRQHFIKNLSDLK